MFINPKSIIQKTKGWVIAQISAHYWYRYSIFSLVPPKQVIRHKQDLHIWISGQKFELHIIIIPVSLGNKALEIMFRRPCLMQMDGWGRHKPQSRLRKVVLEALFYREISVFLCGFFRFFFFNGRIWLLHANVGYIFFWIFQLFTTGSLELWLLIIHHISFNWYICFLLIRETMSWTAQN